VGGERSSEAEGELPAVVDRQRIAEQEAENTLRQYDLMDEMVAKAASSSRYRLRPSDLLDLHRVALDGLSQEAGVFRRQSVRINKAQHLPPRWEKVPRLVDELCDYVNDNWDRTAVHLSSLVMWRLNWIHPFIDGNGRTSRAVSYLVLCVRLGYTLPGEKTIPELIAEDRTPYYQALEQCDELYRQVAGADQPKIDITPMEELMKALVGKQLAAIARAAGAL
jgi:Fic family protein